MIPGKVFEYVAAERPILAAVPPGGAAAKLIDEIGAGIVAPVDDVEALRAALVELHARWKRGELAVELAPDVRERVSRRARVAELAAARARARMKVVVLTTSYPRFADDAAGRFVADAVEQLRARGVDVEVVSPASFRHFGIAYGAGVAGNLRRRPWLVLALPLVFVSFARAARRAARDADVVHAHWLPTAAVALATRRPVVLTVHGTDLELARRARPLARAILRRVGVVLAVSSALAEEVRALARATSASCRTASSCRAEVGEEAEPPEILFAGTALAREGDPRAGRGRARPHARRRRRRAAARRRSRRRAAGSRARSSSRLYARAAVVACPSHREGFGLACAEAMAHGRAVVASDVGGLRDLVVDGETGLLVPPRDVAALRAALERLLGDAELRRRLGAAGRERVRELCAWSRVTDATIAAYEDARGQG